MKKGQASIEYLATYGWALMVLLVMISLLTYYGVIDLKQFAPDKCDMGAEFTCLDHVFEEDTSAGTVTLRMILANNLPDRVFIKSITCKFEGEPEITDNTISVNLGTEDDGEISCQTTQPKIINGKGKLKASFTFVYSKKDKPFDHEVDGTVFGPRVEV